MGSFRQRICVYDGYWRAHNSDPVFFYTGNESPVEEYVNNTGLLWTLAEKYKALVIFAGMSAKDRANFILTKFIKLT